MAEDATIENEKKRKSAYRFKAASDIDLLKEVMLIQPFAAAYGQTKSCWEEFSDNLCAIYGSVLTGQGCRKRFDDLMAAFKEQSTASLRASGTDEEYLERDQLLQDLSDMIDVILLEKKTKKELKDDKVDRRETDGHAIRDAAMYALKRKSIDGESNSTREKPAKRSTPLSTTSASAIDVVTTMMEKANANKNEELALQREATIISQRKRELEEARFHLDKFEREERLAIEKREREERFTLGKMERESQIRLMHEVIAMLKTKNK
ncbi:hypothetical protein AC1031_020139 [Aphanomyces cochlioides]|nr:hypothetical protein AC1031_020139 [Aphanomyces cochlioides]